MDDFHKMFPTEEACVEYLRTLRWSNGYVCRCTSTRHWSRGRGLVICRDFCYRHSAAAHKHTEADDATPLAQLVASLFKRWWLGTHQGAISPENLRYYLDEFMFRFNRRKSKSRGLLFYRLIKGALTTAPLPAKSLKINI